MARKLCSVYVDPAALSAYVAGHLIAIDKNPGVCPIGVGEVCRRIISKAILRVVGLDIQSRQGPPSFVQVNMVVVRRPFMQ